MKGRSVKLLEPCFIIPYEEAQFTLSWFINPVQSLHIPLTIGVISYAGIIFIYAIYVVCADYA